MKNYWILLGEVRRYCLDAQKRNTFPELTEEAFRIATGNIADEWYFVHMACKDKKKGSENAKDS